MERKVSNKLQEYKYGSFSRRLSHQLITPEIMSMNKFIFIVLTAIETKAHFSGTSGFQISVYIPNISVSGHSVSGQLTSLIRYKFRLFGPINVDVVFKILGLLLKIFYIYLFIDNSGSV